METKREDDEMKWIGQYAPCFQVDSNNIEILSTPSEFYDMLVAKAQKARHRIVMSSLYLGTGELEKTLVSRIEENLNTNASLKVKFLLDYSRGLRGTSQANSSKTLLQPLVNKYFSQFSLHLYHTPNLRGVLKSILPERTNETIGVLHMKIYLFDNDLIISGANLSNDYFTNRQDRYILIKNCDSLCNFFENLVDSVSEFSFQVDDNGECVYPSMNHKLDPTHHHPYTSEFEQFCKALGKKIEQLLVSYKTAEQQDKKSQVVQKPGTSEEDVAYVYPLLQLYDCGVRTDELVTNELFRRVNSFFHLAVGYFNLTNEYIHTIVKESKAKFSILLSSPEANGFFNGQGFSKNIPGIYSHYEEEFFKFCKHSSRSVSLYEYNRDNWTFHAKGAWCHVNTKSGDGPAASSSQYPNLTIIGSSNYGYRSVYKDVEAQLVIYAPRSIGFQTKLNTERQRLFENHTTLVTSELFTTQSARNISVWLRMVARAMRSYF